MILLVSSRNYSQCFYNKEKQAINLYSYCVFE